MGNSKTGEKEVLIINSYGPNRGDSAVLQSMIDTLRGIGNLKITVSIPHPEYVPKLKGVEVVPSILSKERSRFRMPFWAIMILLCVLLSRLNMRFLHLLPKEDRRILTKYFEARIILSAGGHHLTDIHGFVSFFKQWYQLLLATAIGKPTVIYAQTIGPFMHFPSLLKFLTKFVLDRMRLIMVREENSRDILVNTLDVTRPPIYTTADAAFLLNPSGTARTDQILASEGIDEKRRRPLVGLTVYRASYHGHSNPEEKFAEYKKIMAKIADHLIHELDATVIFIPMEMQYGVDIPLIISTIDAMKHRNRVSVLRNTYSSKETKGIIGRLDFFIGAKTHSIIFALSECVPTLCIAYHRKSKEFMGMFGLNEYVHDIETLDFQQVAENLERLIDNKRQIKRRMESRIHDVHRLALLNAELVRDTILRDV